MVTILLHGELRRLFGRRFLFDVRSPAEAVRALSVQLKGFRQYFVDRPAHHFRVLGKIHGTKIAYGPEDLSSPQSSGVLRIVPLISGAGPGLRFVVGAVMAAVGYAFGWTGVGAIVGSLGLSLMAGSVAEMLAGRPKAGSQQERPENTPSYAFDGAVNTMGQGGPVPIGYGRMVIGSQVISVGFSTNNEVVV